MYDFITLEPVRCDKDIIQEGTICKVHNLVVVDCVMLLCSDNSNGKLFLIPYNKVKRII